MAANYITALGVQQFSIKIGAAATSNTATINAVGSGAFILFGGVNPSVANNPAEDFAYVTLTNSTTITATRNSSTGSPTVTGCIIDGDTTNLIKSVQYGTATIANLASTGTAAITGVKNANTAVHLLGWQSANTTLSGINEYPIVTLSGTTVTATRVGTVGALVVGFVVIEFQSSCLNQSVQNIAATSALSTTSYTAAVTSVVINNSISLYAGSNTAVVTTNVAEVKQYGSLTSSTVFTVNVNTAIANAKSYNCSIVEFKSGILKSAVQRSTTTLTAVKSNSTTLSSVAISNSGVSWLGNTTTATTAVLNQAEGQAVLSTEQPIVVQDVFATGSTSPVTVTPASTASGNAILVAICAPNNSVAVTITGVTDNLSQTYTQNPSGASFRTTNNSAADIWYFPNTASGVTSISVSFTGTAASNIIVSALEVSNVATSNIVDSSAVLNNGAATTSPVTGNITTTLSNDFIITSFATAAGVTLSPVAPYSIDTNTNETVYGVPNVLFSGTGVTAKYSAASATYCASVIAIKGLANNTVTISKQSATSTLVGSWEVFEFPAFVNTLNAIWFGAIA